MQVRRIIIFTAIIVVLGSMISYLNKDTIVYLFTSESCKVKVIESESNKMVFDEQVEPSELIVPAHFKVNSSTLIELQVTPVDLAITKLNVEIPLVFCKYQIWRLDKQGTSIVLKKESRLFQPIFQ